MSFSEQAPHALPTIKRAMVLALILTLSGGASANVFRCKLPNGTTVFQDVECKPEAEALRPPKTDTRSGVDFTLPLAQRIPNAAEKSKLDAAMTVAGLQRAMSLSLEHCEKHGAAHAGDINQVIQEWRQQRALALENSERLLARYTTATERAEGQKEIIDLMGRSLLTRDTQNVARNATNCMAAPAKLRSFLANRYTEVYAVIDKPR